MVGGEADGEGDGVLALVEVVVAAVVAVGDVAIMVLCTIEMHSPHRIPRKSLFPLQIRQNSLPVHQN